MRPFPYDLYHLWASAQVARLGGNPYEPAQITPVMLEAGWPPSEMVSGFMHPFWSLALLTPFSYLPFPVAALVWELLIVALVIASIRLLYNDTVRREVGPTPTKPSVMLVAALFPPLVSTIAFGQTSALLLFGCAGWLSSFCHKRFFISGVLLSLTTLKPQLFIPLYVWIFLNQIRSRQWWSLVGFFTGLLLQCSLAALFAPHSLSQWVTAMSSLPNFTLTLSTPAVARIIGSWLHIDHLGEISAVIGAATATVMALTCRGRVAERAVLFFIPLGLVTTAYVWSHSFLVLLMPYLVYVAHLERKGDGAVVSLSLALAAWGILDMCFIDTMAPYFALFPLAFLLLGVPRMFAPSRGMA